MFNVLCDVLGFCETAGTVQFCQGEEGAAHDVLGRVKDPLEAFPLSHCIAGVPPTDTIIQGRLTLMHLCIVTVFMQFLM